jgi:ATP dependent DNA ligase C terminal region
VIVPVDRVEKRLGDYGTVRAELLADPLLWGRVQEARRLLSSRMTSIARDELKARIPSGEVHVSRKVDGEFTVLVVDGEEAFTVNPGGTVRVGLPLLEEAAMLVGKAGKRRVVAVGELYLHDPTRRTFIHDVNGVLNRPVNPAELDRIRFAAFDLLEPAAPAYADTVKTLGQIFGKGTRVHPVEGGFVKKVDDVEARFRQWVETEGAEGIVVRSDQAGLFKVKNRRTLDAVVVGYSEGVDDRKGLVHDLLVALVRDDGTFHVLGRVGGGFGDEERRSFRASLGALAAPSDYTEVNPDHLAYQMVRPEWVVEVSYIDLLTQTTRGGPIERMVLGWDGGSWRIVRRLPLCALIGPSFVRRREDKKVAPSDLRLAQVTDFVDVPLADRDARTMTLPRSELLRREVWTKVMRGQTMVRKLLLWKTNKDRESDDFPAFVLYLTDYSPNRKDSLEREIRIGRTLEEMEGHWAALAKEKIVGGWIRLTDQ